MPIKAIGGGRGGSSPAGVYETVALLEAEHPNGALGTYVVKADGQWYYWDGTGWASGGAYQEVISNSDLIEPGNINKYFTAEEKAAIAEGTAINDGAITSKKVNFLSCGKNTFNPEFKNTGYYVSQDDGLLYGGGTSTYTTTDYISVLSETEYTKNIVGRLAYYRNDKSFISGTNDTTLTFTTPANCAYIRASFPTASLATYQIEKGGEITSYESFYYVMSPGVPENRHIPLLTLPSTLYSVAAKELNIYFENIIDAPSSDYYFDVVYGASAGTQQNERWKFVYNSAGTPGFTLNIYDKNYRLVGSKACTVKVSAATAGDGITKKVLVIGDSTTSNGAMLTELLNLFSADAMNITLIGTKGTAPALHEAVSGKTAEYFYSDATSPFVFSGSFDFAQYMATSLIDVPDYVVFNLGINDVFTITNDATIDTVIASVISRYESMITNIKAYNANIKFGIALTIPASADQDAYGAVDASNQTQWMYRYKNRKLVKALIDAFEGREAESVYLLPLNVNLDTEHNMSTESVAVNSRNETLITRQNNAVHPANSGYCQIADVYYYWLKSFET